MGHVGKWLAHLLGWFGMILVVFPQQVWAQSPWDVFPKGISLLELSSTQEQQTEGVDSAGVKGGLSQYLVYQSQNRNQITEDIQRDFTHYYLSWQYGLKDNLNLRLELNSGQAKQSGTVSFKPSLPQNEQSKIQQQLQPQSSLGNGNHNLMLVFHTLMFESRAVQWRFGYSTAVSTNDFPYSKDNPYSLSIGSYSNALVFGGQNTFYPATIKGRLDIQVLARYHMKTPLSTTDGTKVTFQQGHEGEAMLHWQILPDPFIISFGLQALIQGRSIENETRYNDNSRRLSQMLGFAVGNLQQLEAGRMPHLPWQLEFKQTTTRYAMNSPLVSGRLLSLLVYF